jgi:hypothetical protein
MAQKERTHSLRSYMRLKPAKVKSREKQTLGRWVRLNGVSSHPRLRFSIWPILFHVESLVVRYDLHVPAKICTAAFPPVRVQLTPQCTCKDTKFIQ